MSKKEITTIQSVVEKHKLTGVEVLQPSLESVMKTAELNEKETAVLTSMSDAVKNSKKSMYEVMYYSGIISRSPKLLEKLHYQPNEFGKFCYDYFGFDKSKASKYAKVGRLYMVQDTEGTTKGQIHSVFATLDVLDNYEDYTPTQLVEMLLPDELAMRGVDGVIFWNSVIEKCGKSRMKVAVIRDFISSLKYVATRSQKSLEGATIKLIEERASEITATESGNVQPTIESGNVQPTTEGGNVQPTTEGGNVQNDDRPEKGFEMSKPEEYKAIELLEMLTDKIDELKALDVKEVKKYTAIVEYFKALK